MQFSAGYGRTTWVHDFSFLDVAESTVKIHVQHILRKLGLTSRVPAAVWAVEHGVTAKA